jgi:hypothetical protein
MNWLKKLFRKEKKQFSHVVDQVVDSVHNVMDYTKDKYHVYWETLIDMDHHGNTKPGIGVVRFYDRRNGKLLSYSTFEGSKAELHQKIDQHIATQMPNYKV